ncbi:MAG TPA: hypothetical protein VF331_05825 [Polyangiales bacterium]
MFNADYRQRSQGQKEAVKKQDATAAKNKQSAQSQPSVVKGKK